MPEEMHELLPFLQHCDDGTVAAGDRAVITLPPAKVQDYEIMIQCLVG